MFTSNTAKTLQTRVRQLTKGLEEGTEALRAAVQAKVVNIQEYANLVALLGSFRQQLHIAKKDLDAAQKALKRAGNIESHTADAKNVSAQILEFRRDK